MECSCVICFEAFEDNLGIKCGNGHFLCKHDFSHFVAENVLTQVFKLRRNKGRVSCPSPNCDGEFNILEMFKMLEKRERARYTSIIGQINHEHSIVIRLRDAMLDILTLKCPKCKTAVDPSPDACSAIMCLNCGSYYCNCCFMSFDSSDAVKDRAAAHEHCATHKPISENKDEARDAFLPSEVVAEGQRSYQIEQLKKCLTLAMTSKTYGIDGHHDINIALVLAFEDLSQLGIDASQLANSVIGGMNSADSQADSGSDGDDDGGEDTATTTLDNAVMEGVNAVDLNDQTEAAPTTLGKQGGPQLVNAIATLNSTAITQILSSIPPDQLDLDYVDPRSGLPLTSLALITGQTELAQQLITLGANVTLRDRKEHTVLYIAIESGSLKLVDHILKCNPQIDLNQPVSFNRNMYHPMHVAARFGHGHILRYLAKRGASLEQLENELRYTPLVIALAMRLDWAATELLLLGAQFKLAPGQNRCALHLIAERGLTGLLHLLHTLPVHKTSKFDVNQVVNVDGMTMLHVACIHNQPAMVEQLMQMGANVNALSTTSMLPFAASLFGNNQLSAILMMKHGAQTSFAFNGRKTMYIAVEKGMEQVVELLITKCGYDVNASTVVDEQGERPLHIAVLYKQNKLIPCLLHHKADVTLVDRQRGLTPLMLAILVGNEMAARMMLSQHLTVHTVYSTQGRNCLYMAAEKGNTNMLSLILTRCKADINGVVELSAKLTALHVACCYDKAHAVRFLLQLGADVNVLDANNKSPLDCAREHSAFSAEAAIMEFISDLISSTSGTGK